MTDPGPDDPSMYRAVEGVPRYNPQRKTGGVVSTDTARKRAIWINGAIFALLVPVAAAYVLGARPLVALAFPGALMALTLESVVAGVARWEPTTNQRFISLTVIWAYVVAVTTIMFVAYSRTDDSAYRDAGFWSGLVAVLFTIGFLIALITVLIARIRGRRKSG